MNAYMSDELIGMFKSLAPFDDDELEKALPLFKSESFRKGDFFSKAGRISDRVGFVESGLLRSYFDIKGKETTTFFLQPGSVAAALLSFLRMKPAVENIQAITDSELIYIKRKDLFSLYEKNWKWQQVGRVVVETYYVEMEQRSISLQTQSAHERYLRFIKEFPEVIKTVPLNQIASFLGVSSETLSRIRKKASQSSVILPSI